MKIHRSIYERSVFLDTGALIALNVPSDEHSHEANTCSNSIYDQKLPTFVSNVSLIETHKRILFDINYQQALNFLNEIYASSITILRFIESDELEARKIISKFSDQQFTFYDAINFAIMKRVGIFKAFTFDHHYSVFGFQKIPPFFP